MIFMLFSHGGVGRNIADALARLGTRPRETNVFILIQCKFLSAELGKINIFLREKYLKGWQILPFDIQFFIFKVQSN